MKIVNSEQARLLLQQGKIIAYPTEALYGLGCDPFNKSAVDKLLALKQREASKGLILLIADWSQLSTLIRPIPEKNIAEIKKTWPGPVTWIFPKSNIVPDWISGEHATVAIRMTAHACARELSRGFPLVSTSANITDFPPAVDVEGLKKQFPEGVDAIVEGALGGATKPSTIYDVLTGQQLR